MFGNIGKTFKKLFSAFKNKTAAQVKQPEIKREKHKTDPIGGYHYYKNGYKPGAFGSRRRSMILKRIAKYNASHQTDYDVFAAHNAGYKARRRNARKLNRHVASCVKYGHIPYPKPAKTVAV